MFIQLNEIDENDTHLVGNKAARLAQLQTIGFPVPPGLVLTTAIFRQAMAPYWDTLEQLMNGVDLRKPARAEGVAEAISELLAPLELPAAIQSSLRQELAKLRSIGAVFALVGNCRTKQPVSPGSTRLCWGSLLSRKLSKPFSPVGGPITALTHSAPAPGSPI